MIYTDNKSNIKIETALLEKIAKAMSSKDIELVITDSKDMQKINKQTRGIDKETDVLSFPLDDMPHVPLGSIVINSDLVEKKAKELGHSFEDELSLLFIHGLLHLLGFDHENDSGEMRKKEEELINQYNLPKSLILRNGDDT